MLVTMEMPTARSIYFDSCFGTGPSTVRTEALGVVRNILARDMPAWFTETYSADGGGVDRERLWSDIKKLWSSFDRNRSAVVSLLRNSFGGYCDSRRAYDSFVGQGATRVPWRNGGCVPLAPASLTVTAGLKELILSSEAPAGDGGSPIEGYKLQWKSGDEEYASSRQAIVTDPGNHTHTIKGLTVGGGSTRCRSALQYQRRRHRLDRGDRYAGGGTATVSGHAGRDRKRRHADARLRRTAGRGVPTHRKRLHGDRRERHADSERGRSGGRDGDADAGLGGDRGRLGHGELHRAGR